MKLFSYQFLYFWDTGSRQLLYKKLLLVLFCHTLMETQAQQMLQG